MNTPTWQRLVARSVLVTFTTSFVACGGAQSQTPPTTTMMVVETATTSPPPPTLPVPPGEQLGKQQLRELVAPVALYPDVVLASLLPATTNRDQVHEAAQFVGQAEHVDTIPDDRGWDGGVRGLVQFPDVLRWLDANPTWTDGMGQAVTYQQQDVLDAIQDYRRAAKSAGNLTSNRYQTVRTEPDQDIRIEPARPDIVYVPSYDPVVATQPQPAQESAGINPWIAFGGGALVGALGAWALYSIFDDDNDNGGGHGNQNRRRIKGYDNYYYARGKRPKAVEWTPRAPASRKLPEGWQHPKRLEHVTPAKQAATPVAPSPPTTRRAPQKAPRPAQVRRQQRHGNRQQHQTQRQEKRRDQKQQRQERQGQRQERRQQNKTERRADHKKPDAQKQQKDQ